MPDPIEPLSPQAFEETDGLADWRVLGDGATAFFATESLARAARLAAAIAEMPEVEAQHPAIDIRTDGVTVRLLTLTAEYAGMTVANARLAAAISAAARELAIRADPSAVQGLLLVPGATDIRAVMPFWRAALGYEPRIDSPNEDLVDPRDRGTAFWFETMEEPRGDGGGAIHVAVWVPHEQAEARVAAALAAGGRLVRDDNAPAWWTLADAAGNEVDIATSRARE